MNDNDFTIQHFYLGSEVERLLKIKGHFNQPLFGILPYKLLLENWVPFSPIYTCKRIYKVSIGK